ncbi:SurA N-terminal domain-containing protein [Thalassolituus sp. LLYu03]|uniref:SurA N-terminal domain-containing protein n=1 Tax=Thalassolituus sp. LLYu03 TaxID=3421656 RepID=UPI003D2CD550
MLQTMRDNAQGMIAKVIVFFIIFVFALWGVESIVNLGGGTPAAVSVGGEDITEDDIARLVEQQKSNLRRQFGDQYDENLFNEKFLRESAIEQLIEQKVALVQANDLGLYASTQQIDQNIISIPAFQQDGRFDKEQFQTVLRMNGLTPLTFRSMLADDIKTNQVRAALVLSSVETPFAVQVSEALSNELRTFSFYEVNAKDLEATVNPTDEEVSAYYDANKDRYRTEEQVSVRYVQLSKADLAAKEVVEDEEIQQAYDDYRSAELAKEQRHASHILIEVNDERDDAKASALAAELYARVQSGGDFAALAKEYSDDIGTKNAGGDLGLAMKGAYVTEFEDALYALKKGEVSQPVKTEFGYHLIKLDDVVTPAVKALADVKDQMVAEVQKAKAEAAFAEMVQELSNISFSADSVETVASALKLDVKETTLFTRNQGDGLAGSDSVRQAAFSDKVLLDKELSDVIETGDSAVVLGINEHLEASVLPVDVVRPQVVAAIKRDQASEKASALAQKIVAGEESVSTWKNVSATYSQSSEAPRAAQQKAFGLTVGQKDVVKTPGGFTIVEVKSIEAKAWSDMAVSDESREGGRSQNSREDMMSYQSWAKSAVEVKRSGV